MTVTELIEKLKELEFTSSFKIPREVYMAVEGDFERNRIVVYVDEDDDVIVSTVRCQQL